MLAFKFQDVYSLCKNCSRGYGCISEDLGYGDSQLYFLPSDIQMCMKMI